MHSWIFRHRLRLLQIYGRVPPPPLPGARAKSGARTEPRTRGGSVERRTQYVLLQPMPRRATSPR